jgi:hypothetical protein
MYMAADELASQFHGIRENLQKLREAITKGFFPRSVASCHASELVDRSARRGVGAIFQIMPLGSCEV